MVLLPGSNYLKPTPNFCHRVLATNSSVLPPCLAVATVSWQYAPRCCHRVSLLSPCLGNKLLAVATVSRCCHRVLATNSSSLPPCLGNTLLAVASVTHAPPPRRHGEVFPAHAKSPDDENITNLITFSLTGRPGPKGDKIIARTQPFKVRAVWQRIVKMRQLAPMTRPMSESDGRTSEAIAVQTPGFREAGLRADTDRRGQLLRRRREGSWLLASRSSVWPAQCRPGHRPSTTLPTCAGGAGCCPWLPSARRRRGRYRYRYRL